MTEKLTYEKRLEILEAKSQVILEGFNTILSEVARLNNVAEEQKSAPTDPTEYDKIFWETKEGNKGPYQQTSKKSTQNHPIFQNLQERLKKHGKARIGSYFYWLFDKDPDTIGRKLLAK